MRRSTDHILTTHVGSLPPPTYLDELYAGPNSDHAEFFKRLQDGVKTVVTQQLDVGLDVINDGEFSKVGGWSRYIRSRLSGYELKPLARAQGPEQAEFPEYFATENVGLRSPLFAAPAPATPALQTPQRTDTPAERSQELPLQMVCTGPISYVGGDEIARDVANLQAATSDLDAPDVFMCSVSPDNINYNPGANRYYATEEEYILANAKAMREEYLAITNTGFTVQIDMPVMKFNLLSLSVEQFRQRFAVVVDIVNEALAGIPPDQARVHICYGGGRHPHTGDLNLNEYIDLVFKLNVAGISFEQSVRHEHEWHIFETVKVPDGKYLIPGVVAHSTDMVEHPELVAERLVRLAKLVGPECVVAGTDCGLGGRVPREVVWAKFRSMAEGVAIANKQLFGKS